MNRAKPLRLTSGPDRLLQSIPLLSGMCALSSLAWLDLGNSQELLFITSIAFSTFLLSVWPVPNNNFEVVIRDQSAAWRVPGGPWHTGGLAKSAWAGSRYAVICCNGSGRNTRLLISRSRHDEKTYKMLRARIRLNTEQGRQGI